MSFCDEISVNCDECLEVSVSQCTTLNVVTENLTPGTTYYLHLIDKFENYYTTQVTIKADKSFDIIPSDFDAKLFVSSNGKLEAFLSTISTGQTYNVTLTIELVNYKCLIISIS